MCIKLLQVWHIHSIEPTGTTGCYISILVMSGSPNTQVKTEDTALCCVIQQQRWLVNFILQKSYNLKILFPKDCQANEVYICITVSHKDLL